MLTVLYLPVTHCSKMKTTIKDKNSLKDPKFSPCCPLSLSFSHHEKKYLSSKHRKFEVKPFPTYFFIPFANKHDSLINEMKAYTNLKGER